jgi:hypothetical protein
LDRSEDAWLFRVLRDFSVTDTALFEALPDDRRAAVIDVATEYLAYQKADDPDRTDHYNAQQRRLLVKRAALHVVSDQSPPPAPPPPEQGHNTTRIGMGGGRAAGEWFGQLALRPALHDLLGDETGYTPNTHLEFMNTVLRYNRASRVNLHRLDVIRIVSLTPYDRLISKPSWQISTGLFPVEDLALRDRSTPTIEIGVGGSMQTQWSRREVWYLLGEGTAQYGSAFDQRLRAGVGATGGALVDLAPRWRAQASATYRAFVLGHRSSDLLIRIDQRYTIAPNWDVRLEWSRRPYRMETVFGVTRYF